MASRPVKWFLKKYGLKGVKVKLKKETNPLLYASVRYEGKKKYTVWLYPGLDKKTRLKKLFHELWHIKQMERGILGKDEHFWYGSTKAHETLDYHEWPWEVEAHVVEDLLYEIYKRS